MKRFALMYFLLIGCVDPYTPPGLKSSEAILVIDGFIDVTNESTIKLSRSQNLTDNNEPQSETGATVWVEDDNGSNFFFSEGLDGVYSLPSQSFTSKKYRLNVKTSNSNLYISDFEMVTLSPPIDSITWSLTDDLGVQIYTNTHDPETTEGFYRWTFDETWLYRSAFSSVYVYDFESHSVALRTDDIYNCWRTAKSNDLLIESTTRLSENRVSQYPIAYIKQDDERLRFKYSILVKQYAISKNAFNYWQQLKKTTEDLGTLFGPIPSQVTGNFKSISNPDEPVIGYFSIGSTTSSRIFIPWQQLVAPSFYNTPYQDCESYSLMMQDVPNFSGPFLLTYGIPNPNGPGIIGYYYGLTSCVDCRLSGGVNIEPDFWE